MITYLKIKLTQALALPILVGLILVAVIGAKFFNIPMPTVPAFSVQIEAGGEYSPGGYMVADGSLTFDFGGTQTAYQSANMRLSSQPAQSSLNSFTATQVRKASITSKNTSTTKTKLGVNTAPGRTYFSPKGNQLFGR